MRRHFDDYEVFGKGRRADGSGIQSALLYKRGRFEFGGGGHFWLSDTPLRPGSKLLGMGSPRAATWARLREPTSGQILTWMNVHFSHLARRPQARLVLQQLQRLPRPWLLTEDFNGTPRPF